MLCMGMLTPHAGYETSATAWALSAHHRVPRRAIALLRMTIRLSRKLHSDGLLCVRLKLVTLVPPVAQIAPFGVGRFNDLDFLFSSPGLQLFFAADRDHHCAIAFEIDEVRHVVLCGESFE